MAKILQKYIKFTAKELEQYASNPESCVRCINTDMHMAMGPYGMASFKHALHELLIRTKVGFYEASLNGIVLGIKNIKVLGHTAGLRADDPTMHLVINANFYVFRPEAGAILNGVVRHISKHHLSAVIYRVFNTTIRFSNNCQGRENIAMDQEIKFRIKSFDISNVMPFIEGELILENGDVPMNKSIRFESPEPEEKKVLVEKDHEMLDALLAEIKEETESSPKKNSKRKNGENGETTKTKKAKKVKTEKKEIKSEPI
ncbi:LOW QUALITY PROTEIN: DNA-directed RNA polymerase I subunit RPA43 [Drosophila eugracilis]|uniref:LOW QUALITY PROTEIN: DNA-directed RNA polymerase I subunit RPA43 n=1 Tax=Drosophila eugracilis TaxID=29029 RepID=UPI001BD937DA|nr:LOW QUALITY PROTEIN: DNA-directed RNA polymerase I subunit RPA43 [Drosophila eugracilis]